MLSIKADCKEIAKQVKSRRGEYSLGRTLLENPLERMSLYLSALPDRVKLVGLVDIKTDSGSAEELKRQILAALAIKLGSRWHARSIQNTILLSDKDAEQPKASICFEQPPPNPADVISQALGARLGGHFEIIGGGFAPMAGDISPSAGARRSGPTALTLRINMGSDADVSLQKISIDDTLASVCEEFFALCTLTVNGLYERLGLKVQEQPFFVKPVKVNSPRTNPMEMLGMSSADLEKAISIERPATTWNDIGGQKEAVRLVMGLDIAVKHPELYKKWGTKPPKGVLLNGPPGTGKTLLAKALANATGASFFNVQLPDILSMMHSGSESQLNQVFDIAKENSPSIVFFDELDAIGHDRDFSGSEISRRLVTILLNNLDGLEELEKVIVIGATNKLEVIDPALRRAGRFNRLILVDMPDDEGITQILGIHMKAAEKKADRPLFKVTNPSVITQSLKGMSGADVEELVRRTLEGKARLELEGLKPDAVNDQDLLTEVAVYERLKKHESKLGFRAKIS